MPQFHVIPVWFKPCAECNIKEMNGYHTLRIHKSHINFGNFTEHTFKKHSKTSDKHHTPRVSTDLQVILVKNVGSLVSVTTGTQLRSGVLSSPSIKSTGSHQLSSGSAETERGEGRGVGGARGPRGGMFRVLWCTARCRFLRPTVRRSVVWNASGSNVHRMIEQCYSIQSSRNCNKI